MRGTSSRLPHCGDAVQARPLRAPRKGSAPYSTFSCRVLPTFSSSSQRGFEKIISRQGLKKSLPFTGKLGGSFVIAHVSAGSLGTDSRLFVHVWFYSNCLSYKSCTFGLCSSIRYEMLQDSYFGPTSQYLHVRLSVLRGLACMHGLLHHSPHSPDAFSHPNTRKINSPKFQEPFNIRTSLRRISAGGFEAVLYHRPLL
jgi:hypothetical protein